MDEESCRVDRNNFKLTLIITKRAPSLYAASKSGSGWKFEISNPWTTSAATAVPTVAAAAARRESFMAGEKRGRGRGRNIKQGGEDERRHHVEADLNTATRS